MLLFTIIIALYGGVSVYTLNILQDSDTLVATIATLPNSVKLAGKFILAYPFCYHSFNGIRHLVFYATYVYTISLSLYELILQIIDILDLGYWTCVKY